MNFLGDSFGDSRLTAWCDSLGQEIIKDSSPTLSTTTWSVCSCKINPDIPETTILVIFKYLPHKWLVAWGHKEDTYYEVDDDDGEEGDIELDIERTEKSAKMQAEERAKMGLSPQERKFRVSIWAPLIISDGKEYWWYHFKVKKDN